MSLIAFVLNIPWSIPMLAVALCCAPRSIRLHWRPFAIVITVRSFWIFGKLKSYRGVRAMTQGSIVILGPRLLPNDLEHELIHIEQRNRAPFVHPFLYALEKRRHGNGLKNKYELEAYTKSSSTYLGR